MRISKHQKAEQLLAEKLKSKEYSIEERIKEIKANIKGD